MLGSFATTIHRQAGFQHYLPLTKQHKVIRDTAWRNNPYQLYNILTPAPIMDMNGVDFETTVGSMTLAVSAETLTMTGVDFLTEVGSIDLATVVRSECRLGHELTPFFLEKQAQTNPSSIVRQFTFNNSIFTDRVTQFPSISRTYKDVVAQSFTINVENASQLFNEILQDRTKFRQEGEVNYGYQFNSSHIDFACIGKGKLTNADYEEGEATLTFKNQMELLSEQRISTDVTSQQGVSYVGSEWNPADLTFDILTTNSYGANLDNTQSTANTDIHWESFTNWKNSLGSESIVVNGFFPYETNYVNALQSIAEITDSAIYVEANNQIYFIRNITGVESFSATVVDSDIINIRTMGDAFDMCNEYTVPVSFTVTSNAVTGFNNTISFENTASVNSFGKISKQPTTKFIWYVNSASALNLAQRIVQRRREPEVAITITTPIKYLQQQLGDLIYISHDALGIQDQPYTLIGEKINLEEQTIEMDLSVGHGLAVANFTIFELDDAEIGTLDNTVGLLA